MSSSAKRFALLAAVSLLAATLLGAYASHALSGLDATASAALATSVQYQFYHGLALLAVASLDGRCGRAALALAGWSFLAGIVLFCGGIYATTLAGIEALGPVTPIGGFAFIGGWVALFVAVLRAPPRESA